MARTENPDEQHVDDATTPRGDQTENTPTDTKQRGGPRTAVGKAISSGNSTKYAITSQNPVAGGEKLEEWQAFLEGIRASLQPVGCYEDELVEQIAQDMWALRRIVRCTVAHIDVAHEAVEESAQALSDATERLDALRIQKFTEAAATLKKLDKLDDADTIDEDVTKEIISVLLASIDIDTNLIKTNGSETRVCWLRRIIGVIAEASKSVEARVIKDAILELYKAEAIQRSTRRTLEMACDQARLQHKNILANAFLPAPEKMEVLLRYKTAHERSIERNMRQLEHSQRARNNDLPPPYRFEINGADGEFSEISLRPPTSDDEG